MGNQIYIEPQMQQSPAAIFDPATDPNINGMRVDRFPSLQFRGDMQNGNLGGKFALPIEFDAVKFASAFHEEGAVLAMMQPQPVIGTGYVAEGWVPWEYPATFKTTKLIPNPDYVKPKGKREPGTPNLPPEIFAEVEEEHPKAGQKHTVASQEKNGPTYVLMYRPAEVQAQVNEVWGLLSIDQMAAEARGETVATAPANDPNGLLSDKVLSRARGLDPDLEADRQYEAGMGRSTAVHSSLKGGLRLRQQVQNLSR